MCGEAAETDGAGLNRAALRAPPALRPTKARRSRFIPPSSKCVLRLDRAYDISPGAGPSQRLLVGNSRKLNPVDAPAPPSPATTTSAADAVAKVGDATLAFT